MTKLPYRRLTLLAIAAASILLLPVLPAAGQAEDAEAMVRLGRTISTAHALPGSTFRVTLSIDALQDLDGVGVRENLPFGWTVHPVETEGAAFKRPGNEWVFTEQLAEGTTLELVYEVTVPPADRLYADTLPTCFEITGIFQATVPRFEIPIPGETTVEIVTALPIPTAVAHLVPGSLDEPDRIDLRLSGGISSGQLGRALEYWATDSAVPWTEGEIINLAMMEKLTALYEVCTEAGQPLPLSVDPDLIAVRTIDTFLPCDAVLLPEGCLDPGLPARQFSVSVEITGSHDAYGVGLAEWYPQGWRVTPVEHPGFTYRPSATEWIYPDRLPAGQTITVRYLVEVVESTTDQLSTYSGCCGSAATFIGAVSSGLECSEVHVIGESEAYVWQCLPVLLAISRWDVDEDRLDATLSDSVSFPQVQRAVEFWLSNTAVPHTCGYTVGYHMLKRIIAYWLAGVPVTRPLPGEVQAPCEESGGCYAPSCPGGGLCHLTELQRVEDYVGIPNVPRIAVGVEGARELTCRVPATTLYAVVDGGTPPYRYEWLGPGGKLLGTSDRIDVSEPGTYTAVVVSVGGCRVGQQVLITQDIEVPQVSIDVGSVLSCVTSEVLLTASIHGGRPPFEARWFGESGEPLGEGLRLAVDSPARFTVLVEGANGCTARAEAEVLENREAPTVDAGPDRTLTCRTTEVTLEGSASAGHEPYSYRWTNEDGETMSTGPSAQVGAPGTYTLTVTGANGCSDSDRVNVGSDADPPVVELAASGPITCADSTVTLTATVSEARAPILLAWFDSSGTVIGESSQVVVSEAGVYTLYVQGANGCTAEESIIVNEDTEVPTVDALGGGTLTCATPEVELRAVVAGGRSPYEFAWVDGNGRTVATTETVSVDQPGTYRVTVTGANGCAAGNEVQVHEDVEPPAVTAAAADVLTCRTSTVTLSAAIEGGRSPYEIVWTAPSGSCLGTSETLAVDEPGTYTVTVTGANGCAASDTVAVSQDISAPIVEASAGSELTCDVTEMTLTARITGGREPYLIAWTDSTGAVLATAEDLIVDRPDTYRVTVTGANGCAGSDTLTVTQDLLAPAVEATASGELTCAITRVTVAARITGGREPYLIAWTDSTGAVLATAEDLIIDRPGTYRVTVTGANGCAASDTVAVSQDISAPIVEASAGSELTCDVTEMTLTARITGGREPYLIAWTDSTGAVLATEEDLIVDRPGTYRVTVTGANGCAGSDTVTVTQDLLAPTVEATASGELTCAISRVTLVARISGGREPYVVAWTDSTGAVLATTENLIVDRPGTYRVTVTGANGCAASDTVTVTQDLLSPTVEASASGELTCAITRVILAARISGGREPYVVAWTDSTGAVLATTENLIVDRPGTYRVTVTGANGCAASDTVTVTKDLLAPTVEASASGELTCVITRVILAARISGGREPYLVAWTDSTGAVLATTENLIVDRPGTYRVTVTGANGCAASDEVQVHEDVEPPAVTAAAADVLTCRTSTVTLSAAIEGGRSPYEIVWTAPSGSCLGTSETRAVDEPGTYTVTVTGANGCAASDTVAVSQDISAPIVEASAGGELTCDVTEMTVTARITGGREPYLIAWTDSTGAVLATEEDLIVDRPDTYRVTVTGANGCAGSDTVTVTQDLLSPTVEATASGELTCAIARVTLAARISGGREPYVVAWTDSTGAVLATTENLIVDRPDTYRATVTGANGCAGSDTVTVTQDLLSPTVEASASGELTCAIAKVTLAARISGGREPYVVAWTDSTGAVLATTENLIVDRPGTYRVTVTGANGCAGSDTVTVTQDLLSPTVEATASGELTCAITEVTLAAWISSGREPYLVVWTDSTGAVLATTEDLIVDRPDTYRVTATGANGCAGSDTVTVTQDLLAPTVEACASGELTCAITEVTLAAWISSGREPYLVVWTDSTGAVLATTEDLIVDRPDTYRVTVTGANGCAGGDTVTVTQDLLAPTVEACASGELTCAVTEVTLTAAVEGGRPPYEIAWTDASGLWCGSAGMIVVTEAGTYAVIAVGRNGCSAFASVTVSEDVAPPTVDVGPDRVLTCAEPEIILFASPFGGTGPFTYRWADRRGNVLGFSPELHVTSPGTYAVIVTGANGCSVSDFAAVHDGINAPTVDLGPDRMLGCCGVGIELIPQITGGTEPYGYEWYNECDVVIGSRPTLTVNQPGVYLLIVRTIDGCIASDSVVVREPSP